MSTAAIVAYAVGDIPTPAQLQEALQTAADAGASTFAIAAGDYHFGTGRLTLNNAKNFEIKASGATLWFEVGGGFKVSSSEDVTVNGLTIDYGPTYAQGTVVSCCGSDGMSLKVDFDMAMQLPLSVADRDWFDGSLVKIALWDPTSRTMLRDTSKAAAINIFADSYEELPGAADGKQRYLIRTKQRVESRGVALPLPEGTMVTAFPRGGWHSLNLQMVSRAIFNDLRIYGGSSMGIVETKGGGDNRYYNLLMTRRPLPNGYDRLLAINADGFHSTGNAVGPTIHGSEIGFTGDDVGNINSAFFILLRVVNSTTVTIVDHGSNFLPTLGEQDTVSFYHLNSMEAQGPPSRVKAARVATDGDAQAKLASIRADLSAQGIMFQDAAWRDLKAVDLSLDSVPSGADRLQTCVAHDQGVDASPRLLDSYFHDGYARAWMMKARGARVYRNRWARAGGIHIGVEQNWLEGDPGITDVAVADNSLEDCGAPSITVDETVHGSVTLRNNSAAFRKGVIV